MLREHVQRISAHLRSFYKINFWPFIRESNFLLSIYSVAIKPNCLLMYCIFCYREKIHRIHLYDYLHFSKHFFRWILYESQWSHPHVCFYSCYLATGEKLNHKSKTVNCARHWNGVEEKFAAMYRAKNGQ